MWCGFGSGPRADSCGRVRTARSRCASTVGGSPRRGLVELLRQRRVELCEYVDALHLFWARSWAKSVTSPGLGSEAVAAKPLRVINGERNLPTNEKRGEK